MKNTTNQYNSRRKAESSFSFSRSFKSGLSGIAGFSRSLKSGLSDVADAIAERQYQRAFLPVVSLADCIRYYKEEAGRLQGKVAEGFVLSVRKNVDPRNENDNYVIVQGLVDSQNRPVTVNGKSVSRIMHARTIDDALIKALNGKESCIFRALHEDLNK